MSKTCGCGGKLVPGFIPDFGMMATWVSIWLPGEPKFDKTVWDRFRTGAGVATNSDAAKMIEAHRCETCGQLALFAVKAVPQGGTVA